MCCGFSMLYSDVIRTVATHAHLIVHIASVAFMESALCVHVPECEPRVWT